MSNPAVLIVEDDADINQIVATHLARNGFTCTQAFSGSEAKLLLTGEGPLPFDVVISDLMLPGLAGEELVKLIRAKLRASGTDGYLKTVRGMGFKLVES